MNSLLRWEEVAASTRGIRRTGKALHQSLSARSAALSMACAHTAIHGFLDSHTPHAESQACVQHSMVHSAKTEGLKGRGRKAGRGRLGRHWGYLKPRLEGVQMASRHWSAYNRRAYSYGHTSWVKETEDKLPVGSIVGIAMDCISTLTDDEALILIVMMFS